MKKFISIFFSIYVLSLTLMPCPDLMGCTHQGTQEMQGRVQQNAGDDAQDDCSPFCTCSCCCVSFETTKTFIVERTVVLPQIITFFFNQEFESEYFFSIFEPPKA